MFVSVSRAHRSYTGAVVFDLLSLNTCVNSRCKRLSQLWRNTSYDITTLVPMCKQRITVGFLHMSTDRGQRGDHGGTKSASYCS